MLKSQKISPAALKSEPQYLKSLSVGPLPLQLHYARGVGGGGVANDYKMITKEGEGEGSEIDQIVIT